MSTWTKAPVCCGSSHGAVRSQAETRMMTGPISRASPGFSLISSETLLRLLSRPITATRSFIGVAPVALAGAAAVAAAGAGVAGSSSETFTASPDEDPAK